jgi:hypothetical protein
MVDVVFERMALSEEEPLQHSKGRERKREKYSDAFH